MYQADHHEPGGPATGVRRDPPTRRNAHAFPAQADHHGPGRPEAGVRSMSRRWEQPAFPAQVVSSPKADLVSMLSTVTFMIRFNCVLSGTTGVIGCAEQRSVRDQLLARKSGVLSSTSLLFEHETFTSDPAYPCSYIIFVKTWHAIRTRCFFWKPYSILQSAGGYFRDSRR